MIISGGRYLKFACREMIPSRLPCPFRIAMMINMKKKQMMVCRGAWWCEG